MNILPFLLLISISLLACIIAFASLDGKISGINVMQNFVWNLPVCGAWKCSFHRGVYFLRFATASSCS